MRRTRNPGVLHFNPHSPCGERPLGRSTRCNTRTFQSTLPMRGATCRSSVQTPSFEFQSTLPMRGATLELFPRRVLSTISIHTPHAGSDRRTQLGRHVGGHFNPHSPCGERHDNGQLYHVDFFISIHTPHAGSDLYQPLWRDGRAHFNPHSPCGERPTIFLTIAPNPRFQSTLPMRGATPDVGRQLGQAQISIHTPHAGSDVDVADNRV